VKEPSRMQMSWVNELAEAGRPAIILDDLAF